MSLAKAKIGEHIYEVVTMEEYLANPSMYPNGDTAIRREDGFVYPIRSVTDYNRPGVIMTGCLDLFTPPRNPIEQEEYSESNIIDFGKAENMRELIQCGQMLNTAERSIITTVDNLFVPDIGENDTPEMKALKQAIIDKGIDLDKYEPRFGPNYNNDKRLLRKDSVTFGKLRAIAEALDISATLILEDSNSDVANPIGHPIKVKLTGNSAVSIEEEG